MEVLIILNRLNHEYRLSGKITFRDESWVWNVTYKLGWLLHTKIPPLVYAIPTLILGNHHGPYLPQYVLQMTRSFSSLCLVQGSALSMLNCLGVFIFIRECARRIFTQGKSSNYSEYWPRCPFKECISHRNLVFTEMWFFFLSLLIYFERARESVNRGGAEREGESQAGSSRSVHRIWCRAQSNIWTARSFNWSITQLYTLKILMHRGVCSCFQLVIGHNFNYEIGRQKFNSCVVKFTMVVLFAWLSFIVHSLYFYARAWRTFHLFLHSVVLGFHLKLFIRLESTLAPNGEVKSNPPAFSSANLLFHTVSSLSSDASLPHAAFLNLPGPVPRW